MDKSQFSAIFGGAFDRTISFNPAFARIGGSAAAGLFLSQLFYWSDKGRLADGWIHKKQTEWQDETCLTPAEQKTARAALRATGVLEEVMMRDLALIYEMDWTARLSKELCYRINFEALEKCLRSQNEPQTRVVNTTQEIADRNSENRRAERKKPLTGGRKSAKQYTESTPEISSKTTTLSDDEIDELVKAATWATAQAGNKIKSHSGWEFTLWKRLGAPNGVSASDLSTLSDFLLFQERSKQVKQCTASPACEDLLDPATFAAGQEFLARIEAKRRARCNERI